MSALFDWWTGFDKDNAEAAAVADARLQQLNRAEYGPFYVPSDTQGYGVAAGEAAVDREFNEAVGLGADNLVGGPVRLAGRVVWSVLKALPWWVYVAAGVGLFWYLGGGEWVKLWLKRKARA